MLKIKRSRKCKMYRFKLTEKIKFLLFQAWGQDLLSQHPGNDQQQSRGKIFYFFFFNISYQNNLQEQTLSLNNLNEPDSETKLLTWRLRHKVSKQEIHEKIVFSKVLIEIISGWRYIAGLADRLALWRIF